MGTEGLEVCYLPGESGKRTISSLSMRASLIPAGMDIEFQVH